MRLCSAQELDTVKTFECGQCFRWNRGDDGVYRGVVDGYYAEVSVNDGEVYITSDAPEDIWPRYFDLETDYAEISRAFKGQYLENASATAEAYAYCGRTAGRRCARLSYPNAIT